MADKAIEVLLDERRNFPPPKELKKSANVHDAGIYNKAQRLSERRLMMQGWADYLDTLKATTDIERVKRDS